MSHPTDEMVAFGAALQKLRMDRKPRVTQAGLADSLSHVPGICQPVISTFETGKAMPDAGQLEHILSALMASEAQARHIRQLAADARVRIRDAA